MIDKVEEELKEIEEEQIAKNNQVGNMGQKNASYSEKYGVYNFVIRKNRTIGSDSSELTIFPPFISK